MSSPLTFGIAIPAYNNPDNLRRCLQSAARLLPDCAVAVVDDSGHGALAETLRSEFPAVTWRVHEHNRGFARSANDAVACCPADIVILLNDDVELLTDPRPALSSAFADSMLFAATFRSRGSDGRFREGSKRLVWSFGMPRILHNERDQHPARDGVLPSDYAVGGHAAFRRDRFLDLKGLDTHFDPFYWEDVDLSRRASKRGWNIIYLPMCEVRHADQGAIRSTFETARIREVTASNRLLFAWRHLPPLMWPLHVLAVCWELLASVLSREHIFLHAFSAALRKRRA
jgi:GT2 family glycosyltransferase